VVPRPVVAHGVANSRFPGLAHLLAHRNAGYYPKAKGHTWRAETRLAPEVIIHLLRRRATAGVRLPDGRHEITKNQFVGDQGRSCRMSMEADKERAVDYLIGSTPIGSNVPFYLERLGVTDPKTCGVSGRAMCSCFSLFEDVREGFATWVYPERT